MNIHVPSYMPISFGMCINGCAFVFSGKYHPGTKDKMHTKDGDPGLPGDSPDFELVSVSVQNASGIWNDITEFWNAFDLTDGYLPEIMSEAAETYANEYPN